MKFLSPSSFSSFEENIYATHDVVRRIQKTTHDQHQNEFQKCMHIKLTPNCEEYLSNSETSWMNKFPIKCLKNYD